MSKESKVLIEPKKDEFKEYLNQTGISQQFVKILISLYEEQDKPTNPYDFIKRNFAVQEDLDVITLKNEVIRLKEELEKKEEENNNLVNMLERAKKEYNIEEGFFDEK